MLNRLIILSFMLLMSLPAQADQPEAREIARINNCPPKKIDVYQNSVGSSGKVIYQVTCTLPKATGQGAGGPDALLISCDQTICELLRPITLEKK